MPTCKIKNEMMEMGHVMQGEKLNTPYRLKHCSQLWIHSLRKELQFTVVYSQSVYNLTLKQLILKSAGANHSSYFADGSG